MVQIDMSLKETAADNEMLIYCIDFLHIY